MSEAELSKLITDFMLSDRAGNGKLEMWEDGTVFDSDSNWGFDPKELARLILAAQKGAQGGA